MSTLTEKIAGAFEGHIFSKGTGLCSCRWESSGRGHRTRENRVHLAEVAAAVVAEWLNEHFDCDLIDGFTMDSLASAEALAVIAAEAVKGAKR